MKIKLLLSVMTVGATIAAVGGAANVRAACVPTKDCATLGYKYTAAQCNGEGVACPFDTSKFFCFEPQICNYTITAETCSSQCKSVGTKSCTKNGTTYYEACGSSMCASGQICSSGTCKAVAISGYCCGHASQCSMSGTSSSDDSYCQSNLGKSCYQYCRENWGEPDCEDMWASCRAQGGTPVFQSCYSIGKGGNFDGSLWRCE